MEKNQKKSNRGGARPGAGRKPKNKAIIEIIQENENFEKNDNFEKNIEFMLIPFKNEIENQKNQINLLMQQREELLKKNIEFQTYSKILNSNFFMKLCLKFFGLENFGK